MGKEELSKAYESRDVEEKWYRCWLEEGLFHARDTSDKKPFSIVIPPPNVTGILHIGHALNNTLQDIIVRYRRMLGYNTLWMPGTDHAGIATQNVVEQELAREGTTRHDIGRDAFIERVWEWRRKYGGVIINQLHKLGCSCDWSRERFTMDEGLSRAVREVFVRLYNDDLIYQDDYIVNWCPRCHTAISDLEVEYEEEATSLWHIRYPYAEGEGEIIVATTRPETMLGDTAVAVNPGDERYADVIGKEVILPIVNKRIPIIADDYVSREFGTGAVKITPSADPNDFAMAQRHNLEVISIMDGDAIINENGGIYRGQDCSTCRNNIVEDLKAGEYLVKTEPYAHNVGRCYRCKTTVEPMVSKQWFVRVKPLARAAIAAVVKGETRIVPPLWEATYFDWMDNIRDWCISRQIWWGHRIPVWYCDGCGQTIVSTEDPDTCPGCGETSLRQDEDVLDTWFSSALWPFSTMGWPDKTPALATFYPTSLLITGFDIIFFWVARMMMMGLYVMGDVPFKDVYLHALVRDEKGEKMSKSKGNSVDPIEMIDKYGADAIRFTLAAFTAQGRDVKMSEERIQGYGYFINKIWNTARFSLMNLADYAGETPEKGDFSLCDRWIMDGLNRAVSDVRQHLDEYRFNDAAGRIYQFFWHEFCDWYLELIKPALYGKQSTRTRRAAQYTLLSTLKTALQLLHPFMPFVTEEIWQKLAEEEGYIMVSRFPEPDAALEDEEARSRMEIIMNIITSVRNIRGVMNISPSKKLRVLISAPDADRLSIMECGKEYIRDLANLEGLEMDVNVPEPKGSATGVVGPIRVHVFLEGVVDITAEKDRLEREIKKIEKDLSLVSRKLGNQDFLKKASPEIVEKEEAKFNALREKNQVLEDALARLRDMG
jgi:valyl-tRNA synthetase